MNLIAVTAETERKLSEKFSYYIDCPVDVEMHESEIRRIEIPRELALYLHNLQKENLTLEDTVEKLEKENAELRAEMLMMGQKVEKKNRWSLMAFLRSRGIIL